MVRQCRFLKLTRYENGCVEYQKEKGGVGEGGRADGEEMERIGRCLVKHYLSHRPGD